MWTLWHRRYVFSFRPHIAIAVFLIFAPELRVLVRCARSVSGRSLLFQYFPVSLNPAHHLISIHVLSCAPSRRGTGSNPLTKKETLLSVDGPRLRAL